MYWNLKNRSTIPSLFAQMATKQQDKPALIYEPTGEVKSLSITNSHIVVRTYCFSTFFLSQVWSFRKLQERCHTVVHWALAQGWAEGDVVALYMENQPLLVALSLSLAMIGVEAAFINYNLQQQSLLHCVSMSGARDLCSGQR